MIDAKTLQAMSDEQAEIAARENKLPFIPFDQQEADRWPEERNYPFPNIGSLRPDGWELIDTLFIDKMGSETGGGGGDMGTRQLNDYIREHIPQSVGYAIIEEGQSQLYLGVFKRIK